MTVIKHKIGGFCEVEGCTRPHYGRGLCKPHHQWRWKRGLIPSAVVETLREKIEHYMIPVPESGCWLWTGCVNNQGYGTVGVGRQKSQYAHRVAYQEYVGPIPDGMFVCHKCDTPLCCNPDHLFVGTAKDNSRDAARKGRVRNGGLYGLRHALSIFTVAQVLAIRSSNKTNIELAREYGCHKDTISSARRGITYRDVDSPLDLTRLADMVRAMEAA